MTKVYSASLQHPQSSKADLAECITSAEMITKIKGEYQIAQFYSQQKKVLKGGYTASYLFEKNNLLEFTRDEKNELSIVINILETP